MTARRRVRFPVASILLLSFTGCQADATAPAVDVAPLAAVVAHVPAAFSGHVFYCGVLEPGDVRVTPGGVVQTRNTSKRYILDVTTAMLEDRLDGELRALARGTSKVANGVVRETSTMVLRPTGFPGSTWEVETTFRMNPKEPGLAHGVGVGTGEFDGMTLRWEWLAGGSAEEPAPGCQAAFLVTGQISE